MITTKQSALRQFSKSINAHIEIILTQWSMQHVLNFDNSQRKIGIYLKLNMGLKALLDINGLLSWVLSDREDVVFRNHSTPRSVTRDLLPLLSAFQLMSSIRTKLVPSSSCQSLLKTTVPCSPHSVGGLPPWRMKCGLQTWPPPV